MTKTFVFRAAGVAPNIAATDDDTSDPAPLTKEQTEQTSAYLTDKWDALYYLCDDFAAGRHPAAIIAEAAALFPQPTNVQDEWHAAVMHSLLSAIAPYLREHQPAPLALN